MLDRNIHLKQSNNVISRLSDHGSWMLTALAFSEDTLDMLKTVLDYRSVYNFNIDGHEYGLSPLQCACDRSGSPAIVQELLLHGADPNVTDGHRDTPLFDSIASMGECKNALHAAICLIRYNCNVNQTAAAIPVGQRRVVQISAMDYALIGSNLYAAQVLFLTGVQNASSFVDLISSDIFRTLLPRPLRCTVAERDAFIKQHLAAPRSLFILCRTSIRKALGKGGDHKVGELGLSHKVDEFIRYTDLDRIADRFRDAFQNVPLSQHEP
jgi:hypothetical protein